MSLLSPFRTLCLILFCLAGTHSVSAQYDGDRTVHPPDPDLIVAIRNRDTTQVQSLLARGADPNSRDFRGETALQGAVALGSAELVQMLLGKGADINATTKTGVTALMMAAAGGRIVRTDASGERVNEDSGVGFLDVRSPSGVFRFQRESRELMIDEPGVSVLKLLLSHGAQVNVQAHDGKTALWWAACTENIIKLRLLLDAYADPNLADKEQNTPLILAILMSTFMIAEAHP